MKGDNTMSNRIRELRQNKKMTLKELGEALDLAPNTISQYETGIREPRLKTWQKIADYFDVSIGYLQGIESTDLKKDVIDHYLRLFNTSLGIFKDVLKREFDKSKTISPDTLESLLVGLELSKGVSALAQKLALLPAENMSFKEFEEYANMALKKELLEISNELGKQKNTND